jgi:hypothetical protein
MSKCIEELNVYLVGWLGFFAICTAGVQRTLETVDAHIRRRLRAIKLTHWKTKRTIARKLIRLGVNRKTAWHRTYQGRQSRWAMSHNGAVDRGLCNSYFEAQGLVSLSLRWKSLAKYIGAPGEQMMLALG